MNTYLVEAFTMDFGGGKIEYYTVFADSPQQAADKCREYKGVEYIVAVNLKLKGWA